MIMNKEIATYIVRCSYSVNRELGDVLIFLKSNLHTDDYKNYALGISAAIDGVNVALLNKVLALYPELEAEIESSLAKYDRFL